MGQRVNIQYSVELDDLQEEVNRLFANTIRELEKICPVGGTPVVDLGTEGLDKIDLLRQKLMKIDTMLGDIQNIISGYVRFRTEPPSQQIEQTSDELEIEQLEDKLAKFKEMLDAQSNQEFEKADE
jgi:Mg2+ and Co2+ transporter CorA